MTEEQTLPLNRVTEKSNQEADEVVCAEDESAEINPIDAMWTAPMGRCIKADAKSEL